ncbi:MAG: glycosyltransferase N-terminal domain-containing protein [Verrucomicrobiales bacterium]|nr:glycosyltransferase N-terminal domain-containing protein [Verrucomicrobiales bacterium]
MPRFLVYLIYNTLLPFVLLLGFPGFIVKGIRRGGLARNFRQRFGHYRPEVRKAISGRDSIWIHAVSVGEVFLALKIVEAIHTAKPGQHVVLTTTTTTGHAVAEDKASALLSVIHNPVDLPWIVSRVLDVIRPGAIVLVESEIWPNLLAAANRRGIPVKLANARLSPRSGRRYATFRALIEPIFSQLTAVSVPFEIDRPRWSALGIPEDRIHVLGSVKFDQAGGNEASNRKVAEIQRWLDETGFPKGQRILLAGSTHAGEEELIAKVFMKLRESLSDVALVIVPRHAERGVEISSQLSNLGLTALLKAGPNRVESMTQQGSLDPAKHVWLANTTGELRAWFHLAEAVIIGKSFCGEGGQNPVEPILAGRPVIVGPNMQNFADVMADLNSVRGIKQLNSANDLELALKEVFEKKGESDEMAKRGTEAMARHIGAAERTARFILEEDSAPI